jgi:hypothetical protein
LANLNGRDHVGDPWVQQEQEKELDPSGSGERSVDEAYPSIPHKEYIS